MANGIVVDHKESGVRYAISEHNFNDKVHEKVRDLNPGETVLGYQPRRKGKPVPQTSALNKTEGSSTEGTKDNK